MEEANACTAVRLTGKRQRAKVGDIFRLSPAPNIFLWGRLVKRAQFFGMNFQINLVYIYDVIGPNRPASEALSPRNLILGPSVVNNLGFGRGYWEIMDSAPVEVTDIRNNHLFVSFRGTGRPEDYELVDETGAKSNIKHSPTDKLLAQSGIGNYNLIDWQVQEILRSRGIISASS